MEVAFDKLDTRIYLLIVYIKVDQYLICHRNHFIS